MGWFDDGLTIREGDNVDAEFSRGAVPTFSESFSASYDEVTRTWAQFGMEQSFAEIEQENADRIFELTGERLPSTVSYAYFTALARTASREPLSDKDQALVRGMSDRIARVNQLESQHPEILNYGEMWTEVRNRAQSAEERASKKSSLRPWGPGSIGSFAGMVAGSFTYRDPVNLFTLGAGGAGPNIAVRLATEFGVQAGIETVNQITGVQEKRRLQGLEHGLGQAALAIATVGAGGAAIRGAAEASVPAAKAVGATAILSLLGPMRVSAIALDKVGLYGPLARGAGKLSTSARALLRDAQIVREAASMVGASPHGASRVAEGVHRAELQDAARHLDTPLFGEFDAPAWRGFAQASTTIERLASRDSDAMFAGIGDERPIADIIGQPPGERSTIVTASDNRIRSLHEGVDRLTRQIDANDFKERAVQSVVDGLAEAPTVRGIRAQMAALAKRIEDAPPAERNALRQEREALATELARATTAATARKVAARRLEQVREAGDDMRLQRAQKAAGLDRSQPAPAVGPHGWPDHD